MAPRNRSFKQARAQETYDAILAASARLFPRRGFDATQTPDIAKEAGISTGAVYRYFEDKRQIFLEMLERELGKVRGEVDLRLKALATDIGDPVRAVTGIVDVIFDSARKNAALTRVFLATSLTDPDVAKLRREADAYDRQVLASLLEASMSREHVPDPAATAFFVQVAVVSAATEVALRKKGEGPPEEAVRAAARDILVAFFFPGASRA